MRPQAPTRLAKKRCCDGVNHTNLVGTRQFQRLAGLSSSAAQNMRSHCYIYRDIRKQTDWQSLLTPNTAAIHPWDGNYLAKTNWAIPFAMQDEF